MEALMGNWYLLVILGSVAGIVSGLLGLGSGIILIPGLVFLFSFPQKSAQGTALAVMVPMVLVGAIRYKINPDIPVNMHHVFLIAAGAVVGAFVGTALVKHVPALALRRTLGVFVIVVGIKLILSTPRPAPKPVGPVDPVPANESSQMEEENDE